MSIKINDSYPVLIREFGPYRISRKTTKVSSYGEEKVIFIIEKNTPDIYRNPAWAVIDNVYSESNHDEWTIPLIESLYNEIHDMDKVPVDGNSIFEITIEPPPPAASIDEYISKL